MSRVPFLVAATVVLSALAWTVRLILAPGPMAPDSAALLGLDLVLLSGVAAAGLLIVRGRWARRLSVGLLGAEALLAAVLPIDESWVVALVATAAALLGTVGPWLRAWLPRLPSASGLPLPAVLLALGLPALPGLIGAAAPTGLTASHWVLVAAALLGAWTYSRAWPSGLWASRLLPLAALPAAVASPTLGGILIFLAVVGLAGLAWTGGAALAVSPLQPIHSRRMTMSREVVPPAIATGAGLDRRGRRSG